MANKDTGGEGFMNVSRRDFVKFSATAAAVGGGWALGYDPSVALAYEDNANGAGTNAYTIKSTTCPYCSASCGQRVVVDNASGQVIDIYGDFESPMNAGGLCAKGAGAFQLVTNSRRIGAWPTHPTNPVFAADTTTYPNGVAYKRTGNSAWSPMDLQTAMGEIATTLVAKRTALTDANGYNSKSVAFLGSSHMNNEPNYLYRKLIANFGTSNVEHQARI
jgi:formate dehydrogenase major subunit